MLVPYPAEPMVTSPISTRVNTRRNNSEDILERVELFPAR